MKKTIIAVMLVVTMLMSTVCYVGAAGLTSLDDLRALVRESLVVGDIQVATTGEYANSISVTSSTQFKARATLDMTHVKRDIRRAYGALGSDKLRKQLDEKFEQMLQSVEQITEKDLAPIITKVQSVLENM